MRVASLGLPVLIPYAALATILTNQKMTDTFLSREYLFL